VIVRVLTASVRHDLATRLHALMREQLPLMHEHDGLVYTKLARRLDGDMEQVILFEEWRDPRALYGWVGANLDRARLLPGAEELMDSLVVTHFESLDIVEEALVGD
jgi:hypothetical protein